MSDATRAPRQTACPNCSALISFASPSALLLVCEFCQATCLRNDLELESIGKVAAPIAIASRFKLGTCGVHDGRAFTVRGQIQLDHGRGLWNEWAAVDEDGEWLWIAEAVGELWIMEELEEVREEVPAQDELKTRNKVLLNKGEAFTVVERGHGQVVTVAGELPVQIEVGVETTYVDLSRGLHDVATLDWTRGDDPEVFIGLRVTVESLELDPLTQPEYGPEQVASKGFDCKECGLPLVIHDPEHAVRLACAGCGTIFGVTTGVALALEQQQKLRTKPAIALGSTGVIDDEELTVLGVLTRSVREAGKRYAWREYLLRASTGEYTWLVENNGHWMLTWPVPYTALKGGLKTKRYDGETYKHFTTGAPVVDEVLGEFYWNVEVGDVVNGLDYACGDKLIGFEVTDDECVAVAGCHIDAEEVRSAFKTGRLPSPKGVGMVQPNKHRPRVGCLLFAVALLILIGLRVHFGSSHENRLIFSGEYGPTPAVAETEFVQFSEPFELTAESANLHIHVDVPGIDQGWIGVLGALVSEEDGNVITFSTSAQYYHGRDGGENWSEGDRNGDAWLGSVPAGFYQMRLAAQGYGTGVNTRYRVEVTSQVPRTLNLVLAIFALLAFPSLVLFLWFIFETRRWSESDHPWVESS